METKIVLTREELMQLILEKTVQRENVKISADASYLGILSLLEDTKNKYLKNRKKNL